MVLTLHVSRRWKYYLFKVVFPLLTCTVFCFFSFFFRIDETEARLTVSTTMFLATSALLYVIGTEVPKTSYLTVIDQLVVSVLTVQFLIAFYCCILAALHSYYQSDIDDLGQPFYGLLNLIPMCIFGVMQVTAAIKYFFLPAWKQERDALDSWPDSLKRKTQNPLIQLVGADGSRIGWEDSEGPEDQKPSRFFLFKVFAVKPDGTASGNVFNSMLPGNRPPGELPDPVWKPPAAGKALTA